MFEKILEKLEDYQYSHLVEHDSERIEHCKEQEGRCEGSDCFLCILDRAIEIVQEVAKEYDEFDVIYKKVCELEKEYAENADNENVSRCIRLENLLQYFKEELKAPYQKGE